MEPNPGTLAGSISIRSDQEEAGFESLQFREEIQRLIAVPPENASSFTALLELPATQAMELLHSPHSEDGDPAPLSADSLHGISDDHKSYISSFNGNLAFPSNKALVERAAKFSVFASGENSPETSLVPSNSSANLEKVKSEPAETDSNPNSSQPLISDPTVESKTQRSAKRKEREKKGKGCTKKSKNETSKDAQKLPYVHVRARRGQATDSHSLAERARREKINARMKLLQELVPGCSKISGTALVLDEIINHVQSLQRQVEFLSMRLAAVNPGVDYNLEGLFATESGSLVESNFPSMVAPLVCPEIPFNGNRQHYQQQWHFDALQQPLWGREEASHTFINPENSLLSYDSANSASLHSNQLKMEL
ncbi:hypothetical protein I3843_09G034100 [Carya illinoinensis]|uniref:BHLH domain-containing protein n=1 Tax=Carya illinoinensis TaxID=32201 RepID=A0A8T1P9Z5_CARIL|nr:transcription factor bHLH48-like [Carya illinoinensis]XP_042942576.1 transcription factor bHLH48-like [Carya illinoinensis]KAG6640869.1 hypothetical protein CIPAW_09G033800 [Carya illinoinensis]KAG6694110.1 hypothetical protein I3842_09G033700 [Carya illinoinensis]KAG7961779.1 hypothetical protein I3843_09G034100 [Carya illinoinensis]KAG7961780.1 hypothetical protein I3843_09G034100 [Carya illinoinensis]